MKNILTAILGFWTLGLISCQKEVKDIFSGTTGNATKLVRAVNRSGSDSTVFTFGYDQGNRLISTKSAGIQSGNVINTEERFIRNAQNIVTQIITKTADLVANGVDSVVTRVSYNGFRYTNRVSVIDLGIVIFRDSVAFGYDANGNIILDEDFLDVGTGYAPTLKKEYTYTGKNITAIKWSTYDDVSGSYQEQFTQTLTYDTKTSPLILGNEGIAIGYYNWFSSNNEVKSVSVSPTDPTMNEVQDVTYTYNASGRPDTATTVVQSTGDTFVSSFFYN